MAGGDQAREALTGAPRTVVPHGEGPSSSGGRPLPPPGAPVYLTESDLPALLAEVERERKLRDSWYERCHEAEAEARRQRMRAEKAEAALDRAAELVVARDRDYAELADDYEAAGQVIREARSRLTEVSLLLHNIVYAVRGKRIGLTDPDIADAIAWQDRAFLNQDTEAT